MAAPRERRSVVHKMSTIDMCHLPPAGPLVKNPNRHVSSATSRTACQEPFASGRAGVLAGDPFLKSAPARALRPAGRAFPRSCVRVERWRSAQSFSERRDGCNAMRALAQIRRPLPLRCRLRAGRPRKAARRRPQVLHLLRKPPVLPLVRAAAAFSGILDPVRDAQDGPRREAASRRPRVHMEDGLCPSSPCPRPRAPGTSIFRVRRGTSIFRVRPGTSIFRAACAKASRFCHPFPSVSAGGEARG